MNTGAIVTIAVMVFVAIVLCLGKVYKDRRGKFEEAGRLHDFKKTGRSDIGSIIIGFESPAITGAATLDKLWQKPLPPLSLRAKDQDEQVRRVDELGGRFVPVNHLGRAF